MLLALRSLYETETVTPPVIPPTFPGGGGSRFVFPKQSIGAEVTLRPARTRFRPGRLTATGGATIQIQPAIAIFFSGKLEATGAANIQTESAKAAFRAGKITADAVDNDPLIALSLLDL